MPQYKTPNVYVQEKSIFPPSVAEVATAIPAFIGRTQISGDLKNIPQRITSMVEFASMFGGPDTEGFTYQAHPVQEPAPLTHADDTPLTDADIQEFLLNQVSGVDLVTSIKNDAGQVVDYLSPLAEHLLYPMLEQFFANGGGACYVVSVGDYSEEPTGNDSEKAWFETALDEIAKVDEATLLVLSDAAKRLSDNDYYDLCNTALNQCRKTQDRFTIIDVLDSDNPNDPDNAINNSYRADLTNMRDKVSQDLKYGAAYYPYLEVNTPRYFNEADVSLKVTGQKVTAVNDDGIVTATEDVTFTKQMTDIAGRAQHAILKSALAVNRMTLPPAASMAGIYSRVDGNRGVWKAPANVAVSGVIGPVRAITNSQQEMMNVHDSGKSINAIRAFTGKGTLVWGARTLAGNDNEWRYVPVRRLFNMVEESVQKATAFAVFEPNTPLTWLKLRTMISSYLESLWKQGALFGATADQAFFVNVGLGQTMTEDDINNGIMNIEIGMAAVRPAEFIVLTFSHKSISG